MTAEARASSEAIRGARPAATPRTAKRRYRLNLARVSLVSIRLVVSCVDLGSLSAAAGLCNMSISTASHRIRGLEDALGRTLFHRDFRGLRPTREGSLVAHYGRLLLGTLSDLDNGLDDESCLEDCAIGRDVSSCAEAT